MATKSVKGTINRVICTKDNKGREIVLLSTGASQGVFNRKLVDKMTESIGLTTQRLAKYAKQYDMSFDVKHLNIGDVIQDRDGNDITISIEHDRFENLSITLKDEYTAMHLQADAYADVMKSQFALPTPVATPVAQPVVEVEPAPIPEVIEVVNENPPL